MAGEVVRLKKWTGYTSRKRGEPGIHSEGFSANKGKHCVFLHLGTIDEHEATTEEWLRQHMRDLGFVPEDPEVRKQWGLT